MLFYKTSPSVNENTWTWDLSYRQDKRQIVIRLMGKGLVVKPLWETRLFVDFGDGWILGQEIYPLLKLASGRVFLSLTFR
jgi:hypothetical protein